MGLVLKERPVALVRSGGEWHALHNICTHQFALLSDGYVEDGCIECPLHQGRFDRADRRAQGAAGHRTGAGLPGEKRKR